ncbi:MAG: BrnT family toxin [Cellvibrionaceae bacterium]|nr:BrnT family toxin [Cellvibrionaceae bacterium]
MYFEWDEDKNQANIKKHGIDFNDAIDVFNHPLLTVQDTRFNYEEERWLALGRIYRLVGVVVYTERQGELIRINSARKATRRG